jgi:arginase
MRLVDGAGAIQGDLPAARTHVVDVPLEAGDSRGTGIQRFGSLLAVRERTRNVLDGLEDVAITIGGDCGVELAAVEHALARADRDLAVLWFDAHPDLHTSETSASGAFTGMVLRAIAGEGTEGLIASPAVATSRIVLAGTRSVDEGEADYLASSDITTVGVDDLATPDVLLAALEATGASKVYVHIDVDVLDPSEFSGKGDPVPFGIAGAQLVALIAAVRERFELAGAGITEFAPSSPDAAVDDLPTLLRVIGALTR